MLCIVFSIFTSMLWYGNSAERRYKNSACQYRMIYNYSPKPEMGLVTLGGSRLRVSTSARHFNQILNKLRPNYSPMHNLSHSVYSLEKEYVIARDMLAEKKVKTLLIMIEPRPGSNDYGRAHPDFLEIAKLSDIPLAVKAYWPESAITAINAVKGIIVEHLKISERVGKQSNEMSDRDCDKYDYRLNVDVLDRGLSTFNKISGIRKDWNLDASNEEGFLQWMKHFHRLSTKTNTQIIFLLLTATNEYLPKSKVENNFFNKTQMQLITLSPEIHAMLSPWGKRDNSHLNEKGREIFIPWLVEQIENKCMRKDGCF